MKNILIINGHPDRQSYNAHLAAAYQAGAIAAGAKVEMLFLGDLQFNLNLAHGYRQRVDWEPDLVAAWEKIKWADHLVWVYPVWWGSWPALMKGFVDRVFLPGLTFKKIEGSLWWEKLLKGKTARIITTMDQPGWYYRWVYGRPSTNALKKCTLEFCGVGPVKTTTIGPIRNSKTTFRENWLEKVKRLGQNMD